MRKQYNNQTFTATVNGETFTFNCYTTSTRNGFCHHVKTLGYDDHTRVSYFNRTWEAFDYQAALAKHIEKFPKAYRKELHEILVERKAKEIHEACERRMKAFEENYNKLTDNQKEALKGCEVHSESEANTLHALVGTMALLNAM